ncbi:MAG: hypothetical protein JXR91_06115 [Deltaproteobacteria bacterium]|nr:hypothetical protein [Deltaproteobacteria bacterium]
MRLKLISFLWILFIIPLNACQMDDDDRCTADYVWNSEQAACLVPVDTDVSDTSEPQDGLGDPCWKDEDCTVEDYSHCLLDPTDASVEGMCTTGDCDYDLCGGDFQCCDCIGIDLLGWDTPYCVDATSASFLSALCTCE